MGFTFRQVVRQNKYARQINLPPGLQRGDGVTIEKLSYRPEMGGIGAFFLLSNRSYFLISQQGKSGSCKLGLKKDSGFEVGDWVVVWLPDAVVVRPPVYDPIAAPEPATPAGHMPAQAPAEPADGIEVPANPSGESK